MTSSNSKFDKSAPSEAATSKESQEKNQFKSGFFIPAAGVAPSKELVKDKSEVPPIVPTHIFTIHVLQGEPGVGVNCLVKSLCGQPLDLSGWNDFGGYAATMINHSDHLVQFCFYKRNTRSRFGGIKQPKYYERRADAILAVVDLTERDSFSHIEEAINEDAPHRSNKTVVILVGTKSDLKSKRVVDDKEMQDLQKKVSADGVAIVSVINNENVDKLKQALLQAMMKNDDLDNKNEQFKLKFKDVSQDVPKAFSDKIQSLLSQIWRHNFTDTDSTRADADKLSKSFNSLCELVIDALMIRVHYNKMKYASINKGSIPFTGQDLVTEKFPSLDLKKDGNAEFIQEIECAVLDCLKNRFATPENIHASLLAILKGVSKKADARYASLHSNKAVLGAWFSQLGVPLNVTSDLTKVINLVMANQLQKMDAPQKKL